MSEKVDIIFEGTLSRIGAIIRSKPPWPPGSVGATLFRSLLDANEEYIDVRSAKQELFRAGGYRQRTILIEGVFPALYTRDESNSPTEGATQKEPKGKRRKGKEERP